jgi:hypothetical protein
MQPIKSFFGRGLLAVGLALAALSFAEPAKAQFQYAVANPILSAGTNNVAATATNDYTTASGNILSVGRQSVVALEFRFVGSGAGTANLQFRLDRSLDHIDWVAYTNINVAFNGATSVTNVQDVYVGGAGFLRLNAVANTNAIYGTNLYMAYGVKQGI